MNQQRGVPAVFFKDCPGPGGELFACAGVTGRARNPNVSAWLPAQGRKGEPFPTAKFAPVNGHALLFQ
jgi:hypothetical protein